MTQGAGSLQFNQLVIIELFLDVVHELLLLPFLVFDSIFDQFGKFDVFGRMLGSVEALQLGPLLFGEGFEVDALLFGVAQNFVEAGSSLLPFELEGQELDLTFKHSNLPLVVL